MLTRLGRDRGALGLEAALLAVFLIMFVVVIAYVTVLTSAGAVVADAAGEGARAAAQADDTTAVAAANAAVATALQGWCTSTPVVTIAGPAAIGATDANQLAVTVDCTVDLSASGATGLPGTKQFTATRSAVVDRYRGDGA